MLLDLKQLEADSGISHWTWRLWLRQGRLPVVRVGRHLRVDEADYRAFLARHRGAHTPQVKVEAS